MATLIVRETKEPYISEYNDEILKRLGNAMLEGDTPMIKTVVDYIMREWYIVCTKETLDSLTEEFKETGDLTHYHGEGELMSPQTFTEFKQKDNG